MSGAHFLYPDIADEQDYLLFVQGQPGCSRSDGPIPNINLLWMPWAHALRITPEIGVPLPLYRRVVEMLERDYVGGKFDDRTRAQMSQSVAAMLHELLAQGLLGRSLDGWYLDEDAIGSPS